LVPAAGALVRSAPERRALTGGEGGRAPFAARVSCQVSTRVAKSKVVAISRA
jgi:hypothetical protein